MAGLQVQADAVVEGELPFADGQTIDIFFMRGTLKFAIRSPNPESWPSLNI